MPSRMAPTRSVGGGRDNGTFHGFLSRLDWQAVHVVSSGIEKDELPGAAGLDRPIGTGKPRLRAVPKLGAEVSGTHRRCSDMALLAAAKKLVGDSDERKAGAYTVRLTGRNRLYVVYRAFEEDEGIDYLLHHPDWDTAEHLAQDEGHFMGPGCPGRS
ncbi:hypothetical protein ACIPJK_38945 [Streptomyces roseus]|uniref:hypothetical protein n=1 Tax=Streptomyces roseus TaxID=66430 RepID=UPI00380ED36B